jgi:hypothetical protein
MRKTMFVVALALAVVSGACAADVTASDEYQALELEVADLEQQLTDLQVELSEARAMLDLAPDEVPGGMEVPAEVMVLLDEWWAANERKDGSVVELYSPSGYHLYGDEKIPLDDLAAHLSAPGWESELITEPYLVAAEPEGRYVVTCGVRNTFGASSRASALTFEIVTSPVGDLEIAQTSWLYSH